MSLPLFCHVVCCRPVASSCNADSYLLRRFRVGSSDGKIRFDRVISMLFVSMLQILNLRYFKHCWIIKCVGLKPILFTINMDAASSSKVFSMFDFVFLLVVLLI